MKRRLVAAFAASLSLALFTPLAVAAPAQAATGHLNGEKTAQADKYEGKTICGATKNGGSGYGYTRAYPITISSAGWTRLLKNDPYGLNVGANIWAKTAPQLGTVFPIHNYSSYTITRVKARVPYTIRTNNGLNTAMNNLKCGSTFYLGSPRSMETNTTALHSKAIGPGRFKVLQVRTNGVSFIGTEGVMNGAVMNFRIRTGASRTVLNVDTTGPAYQLISIENWLRSFMEGQADPTWNEFATKIGKAQ